MKTGHDFPAERRRDTRLLYLAAVLLSLSLALPTMAGDTNEAASS